MYFLLKKDGLVLPYIVLQLAYTSVAVAPFLTGGSAKHLHVQQRELAPGYQRDGSAHPLFRAYVMVLCCSNVMMLECDFILTNCC